MHLQVLALCVFMLGLRHTECACSVQLGKSGAITKQDITASSESSDKKSSEVFEDGWCANSNQQGDKWVEFNLGTSGMGIAGVTISFLISDIHNYPKHVLVQYAPVGSQQLINFPLAKGTLEMLAEKPTNSTLTFTGIAASKVRFTLQAWSGRPCMHVDITGCTIRDLCGGDCQNNGVCLYENMCQCQRGYSGTHCETAPCNPLMIPLTTNMLTVSSEDRFYAKAQLPNAGSNRGWCPSKSDTAPWMEIHLSKPLAVSVFTFQYIKLDEDHRELEYMRSFELQYVPPTDSSAMFRSFATGIPSLNGSNYFMVSTNPVVVTKRLRILPTGAEKRACFRLEIKGCDPKSLCSSSFCQNGGTCMGENVCLCPSGFYGDNCYLTRTSIQHYNLAFTRIENQILYTVSQSFIVVGHVTLNTIDSAKVLTLNGSGTYITLDQSKVPNSCLADIDHCTTGLTIGIDINFGNLLDNTFIMSSGGNLPDTSGIALYYHQNYLIYIVSTSTQVWTLRVKYQPVLHKWQHFEITWNAKLGIGLLLDGHLLGTFGRPTPRPTATKKFDLCIGCSHTSNNALINMLVKGLQTWSLDRTNLVNAKIAKPPATTTAKPSTSVPSTNLPNVTDSTSLSPATTGVSTTAVTHTSSTTVKPASPKTTTSEMTTKAPFQEYNITFQKVVGNILITPAFNFTVHGRPELKLEAKGQTALVLNGTRQYVELPDKGIPCLENMGACTNGFTMKLEVKFTRLDMSKKNYIVSSGGDIAGTSGLALYIHSKQLVFAVKQGLFHWVGSCSVTQLIQLQTWYNIEMSWNKIGIVLYIDGKKTIDEKAGRPYSGANVTNPVLIGKTEGANYTAYMHIRNLFVWTASREILIAHGLIPALPPTKPASSTANALTSTTEKQTTTKKKTPTTKPTTTKEPTTKTTTTPTTTEPPITEFSWNFTSTIHTSTTVHGGTSIKDGGMAFHNTSQYIDFGNKLICLTNPEHCHQGLTIQFTIQFKKLEENTYLLTSGGEIPNGVGFGVVYRYGRLQFVVSTLSNSWFVSCGRDKVFSNGFNTVMISWHQTVGLTIFIDNYLVGSSKVPTPHQSAITNVTSAYFGKPHFTISSVIQIEYLLQGIHIWYAHLEILIQKGKCEPPNRDTTTVKQTTSSQTSSVTTTASATLSTKQTPRSTFPSSLRPTSVQQCPVGCVSIGTSRKPTKTATMSTSSQNMSTQLSTSPTPKPKPSTTRSSSFPQTPPAPNTATPRTATTARSIPEYHETPTIHALIGNDKNAYLACTFKGATDTDVVLTVSLLVDDKKVLVQNIPGNIGIVLFSVAKVDDNLHRKKIRCSLKASYSGSTLTTVTTFSNIFIPQFQVSPGRLTVIEGHSAEHVTVTSTAPPQFYCCKGCKGACQIHVVTSWNYDRHDLKCNNKVIAQAVVRSQKPRYFNKYICGFAFTVDNWKQGNLIPVKATIDGRRDGNHHNTLTVKANVFNQPVGVAVTVGPATSFNIATVQVEVKDTDRRTAICKSVNDPHMTTFDGQRYDNMHEGQYILYRHKSGPFEVRADYQRCSSRSRAYCNCAASVKSGDDVITIAGCQDKKGNGVAQMLQQLFGHHSHHGHARTPMTIQMYINGRLTPGTYVRRYGCGQKYEIELPTGTVITVQQSYKPFINIWIKASSSDWQQTEGLCGSYDGHRSNDLKLDSCHSTCVTAFIAHWKVSLNSNFFFGVGMSSQVTGGMYCSCVDGKESICSSGLGVFKCTKSRYDVTSVLVQQAKKPILTRRTKRQASVDTTVMPEITESGVTLEQAEEFCKDAIMNNTVTKSCNAIITSNITDRIEDCAKDYNATGLKDWALDHIRDIAFDCVSAAQDMKNDNNSTNVTSVDINKILANTCVDACEHGSCSGGICECDASYSGETCNVSSATKPDVASIPNLCDMTKTVDCRLAMIYGNNFVDSDDLTCHYSLIKVNDRLTNTGSSGTSKATYISLNQLICKLPSSNSAIIRISNDGTTLSDASAQHVVYNSICHNCFIKNDTLVPRCERKEKNCIINGICYANHEANPDDSCQICSPGIANFSWSASKAAECVGVPLRQTGSEHMERTQIIILAVVCAVFGALIIFGLIYIYRKRTQVRRKKASADYEVAAYQKSQAENNPTAMDNPTYNHRL